MDHRGKLILLPPNRVWRTYPGGRTLDRLAGNPDPADSALAEDWIASATRALNPGREHLAEGVSSVQVGQDPTPRDFAQLLASDPDYFLGARHVAAHGASPMLLVKFLDSGVRLHFQVHPTSEFARQELGASSGKTEAYHVLATRDDAPEPPFIYVGFQRPPSPEALRRLIETHDIAGLEACFDRIPVRTGDTFIIPGGTPHALGAGVFMVEIQEPSDLVVRFEFERAGRVLPESARFMNRGLDVALRAFNFAPLPLAEVDSRLRCRPRRVRAFGSAAVLDELIGPAQTRCFRVLRLDLAGPVTRPAPDSFAIVIVTDGEVAIATGDETHRLRRYEKAFLPAGLKSVRLIPQPRATLLECLPPS